MDYMMPFEVLASRDFGNRLAKRLIGNKPVKYSAAIRHAITATGISNATALACNVMNLNRDEAFRFIGHLQSTKPDDIVSPYFG